MCFIFDLIIFEILTDRFNLLENIEDLFINLKIV